MAVEKFQAHEGHDNPNHAGWRSHQQRMANADQSLEDFQETCFWKKVRDNPQSTSGMDMRVRTDISCNECSGTIFDAQQLGCKTFMLPKKK